MSDYRIVRKPAFYDEMLGIWTARIEIYHKKKASVITIEGSTKMEVVRAQARMTDREIINTRRKHDKKTME